MFQSHFTDICKQSNSCTGKPSYLEPISDSLQKPIGGLPALALFTTKNRTCHTKVQPIYRGGISQNGITENARVLVSPKL